MWDYVPVAMSVLGAFTSYSGAQSAGASAAASGQRARAAAAFTAAQLNQAAGQSVASAQRAALDQTRTAKLINSRALALAAASGGGAQDPGVVDLLARTSAEGAYRAGVAIYQGEEEARQLRMKAAAATYEGELAAISGQERQKAYQTYGTGSLLTAAGSLFSKYGMGGPKAEPTQTAWVSGYDLPMG